jgi:hypothetical protein
VEPDRLERWTSATEPLRWTDDTHMTIGLAESLPDCGGFDGEHLTRTYNAEPWRGYGAGPPQVFTALDQIARVADELLAELNTYVESHAHVTAVVMPTMPGSLEWSSTVAWNRQPDGSVAPGVPTERALLRALVKMGLLASGGLTLRCLQPNRHPSTGRPYATVRCWPLGGGRAAQLDQAAVVAACCTDSTTGEPLPLEPEVTYVGAPTP